jgi:hypothetical protein
MLPVSVWFAFALVLYVVNLEPKRRVLQQIYHFRPWMAGTLVITGFVGGSTVQF